MHWLPLVLCGLLSCLIVLGLMPVLLSLSKRWPMTRRAEFHHTSGEVPRLGGVAIIVAFLANELVLAFCFPEYRSGAPGRAVVVWTSLAMFALGFWDDVCPLGARRKLAGHSVIALAAWAGGIAIEKIHLPIWGVVHLPDLVSCALTCAWLVALPNLFNLSDGADGWAGGLACFLLALLLYLGCRNGAFVLMNAAVLGATFGFLRYNLPPARVYLGDSGAYLLGFQIGLFSIIGSHKGSLFAALLAPLVALALPITDALLAILRRGLRGLPLFRPDRRHLHHRLGAMGLSPLQALRWCYGLSLLFCGFAFLLNEGWVQLATVLAGVVAVLLICGWQWGFSREWFSVKRIIFHSLAMRPEVSYGRAMADGLKQEGARCATLGELFDDLARAARRLGFNVVSVQLGEENRQWFCGDACASERSYRKGAAGEVAGQLELRAPLCQGTGNCPRFAGTCLGENNANCCRSDSRLFETLAELLAEAWAHAVANANPENRTLRFDSPLHSGATARRRAGLSPGQFMNYPTQKQT